MTSFGAGSHFPKCIFGKKKQLNRAGLCIFTLEKVVRYNFQGTFSLAHSFGSDLKKKKKETAGGCFGG